MKFHDYLKKYAELIIHCGVNIQKGQLLNINAEVCHREFAYLLAEVAYQRGARYVHIDLAEPRLRRLRLQSSSLEDLKYVPSFVGVKYKELVDENAANLSLVGSEDPDILSDLDPKKINAQRIAQYMAIKYYYEEGIGKSKVHWAVAAAATPNWGKKVFQDAKPDKACELLWDQIFKISRVDQGNPMLEWEKLNHRLQNRARKLTEMKIKSLHFKGPGTDLTVGLSDKAIFKGGGEIGSRGVEYQPNIPTEECFTTPDYRKTHGSAKTTRPFLINGKMVKGLSLEFEHGEINRFQADEGEETFREYINSDPGAKRLGEVALVGIDSPIYQSGLVFEEILFDENAACHIAIGLAYKFCLKSGGNLSQEELDQVGFNTSTVHTDMMISSDEVDVIATTFGGESVSLLKNGRWEEL